MQARAVRRKRKINKAKAVKLLLHFTYCVIAYTFITLAFTHILLGALTGYGLELELMRLFN